MKNQTTNNATKQDIITANNLQTLSQIIALKDLKTVYAKSGDKMIYNLFVGAVNDILATCNLSNATFSDGMDIIQDVALYLCNYIGKSLQDSNGLKDKNGNDITILRGAFMYINKIIHKHRQIELKRDYIDDLNGNDLQVPFLWDIDNITDYTTIFDIIDSLDLTTQQQRILNARLQGLGYKAISQKLSISIATIRTHLARLQDKCIKNDKLAQHIDKYIKK